MKAYTQKARKEYKCSKCGAVINKGDEYVLISGFRAPTYRRCKGCGYTRADLTTSPYLKWLYDLQDHVSEQFPESETLHDDLSAALQEQLDELNEALENIPEQLRDSSPAAETINERIDSLDSAISELDCKEFPDEDDFNEDGDGDLTEEEQEAYDEAVETYYQECYDLIAELC